MKDRSQYVKYWNHGSSVLSITLIGNHDGDGRTEPRTYSAKPGHSVMIPVRDNPTFADAMFNASQDWKPLPIDIVNFPPPMAETENPDEIMRRMSMPDLKRHLQHKLDIAEREQSSEYKAYKSGVKSYRDCWIAETEAARIRKMLKALEEGTMPVKTERIGPPEPVKGMDVRKAVSDTKPKKRGRPAKQPEPEPIVEVEPPEEVHGVL